MAHSRDHKLSKRGRHWLKHIKQWREDKLSQAEYCRRHSLSASAFGWWKRKLLQQGHLQVDKGQSSPDLIAEKSPFIELPQLSCDREPSLYQYEVSLTNQNRLGIRQGFDPAEVEVLLSALERTC